LKTQDNWDRSVNIKSPVTGYQEMQHKLDILL